MIRDRDDSAAAQRARLPEAARAGAAVWAAYALTECFLLTVPPRLPGSTSWFHELNVAVSALLLALYPAVGALLGIALESALGAYRRWAPTRLPVAMTDSPEARATMPLIAAVGVAQLLLPARNWRLVLTVVGLACGLAFIHLLRMASTAWGERLRFLLSPWSVALLFLATPWSCDRPHQAPALAAAIALGTAGAIAGIAFVLDRRRRRNPRVARSGPFWSRALLYLAASGLLVLVGVRPETAVRRAPLPSPTESSIAAARSRPNLVLVTLDTVRADHLSLYGYERDTTPGLERLAAQADVYTNAIAAAPITPDSHAAIFTGLHARRSGARYDRERCPARCPLDQRQVTLAELLARHGYRTAGVVANPGFLGTAYGLDQGFELYDPRPRPAPPLGAVASFTLRSSLVRTLAPRLKPELSELVFRTAGEINRELFPLLDGMAASNQPFFLFVNYMDAHHPRRPPEPYDRRFPGKDPRFRARDYLALQPEVQSLSRPLAEREREHIVSQYDGAIAYLDDELVRLVEKLRALGIYDDTVLVVTSDHGEAFGERGFVDHGSSTFQDQVHVPLLIRRPGQGPGRRIEEIVSLADLFPTLLELAGVKIPPGLDGVSLLGTELERRRLVLSECYPNRSLEELHPRFQSVVRAAFRGSLKLHVSEAGQRQAFDLAADPHEELALDPAGETFRALDLLLADWLASHPAAARGAAESIDAETRERLRALGYL